jgi:DNA-binding MarR family transcriptional regulator
VPPEPPDFDPLLLSQVRLGVVSVLLTRDEIAFPDLQALLGVTQGNLSTHLAKLEEAGYVRVEKSFVRRRPRTTIRLAAKGRRAFLDHVAKLGRIAGVQARTRSPLDP